MNIFKKVSVEFELIPSEVLVVLLKGAIVVGPLN